MATDIDIASNALVLIGDEPINSFTEPGAGATAAANLYPDTKKQVLALHPWSFALKELRLSKLSQTPDTLTNWDSAFQLPADHIRTWAIFPYSNYQAVGEFIYSNENELLMRYVYDVDTVQIPPHLTKALEYRLAADFAQLITESTSKSEFFERKFKDALASAMSIDSQGHPQQAIVDSPFVDVRLSGRGFTGFN